MDEAQKAQKTVDCGNTSNRLRTYAFTYNNGNSEIAQLSQYFSNAQYVFQEERGEEGTDHLQGVVRWPNKKTFEVLKKDWPKIHWEVCKSHKSWKKSLEYCTKVESRVGGVFTNIKGLEWRSTLRDPMDGLELYGWQRNILTLIKEQADLRTINWVWEETGSIGKSVLVKHICMHYNATMIGGASKDGKYCVKEWLELNPNKDLDVVIYDQPMCNNFMNYAALEEIKNGCMFSPKFKSGCVLFNSPHIIVFANFYPDKEKMSKDRWKIVYATATK